MLRPCTLVAVCAAAPLASPTRLARCPRRTYPATARLQAFIPDRLHQGILHGLLLAKLMTASPFRTDPSVTFGGVNVIAPASQSPPVYFGNSNGGIYGAVIMATSTDITRGTSGVGGTPYALLLPRSLDFSQLFDIIRLRYSDPIDRICLMAALQERWDRMEPSAYAAAITRQPLPNTPVHSILFQHGLRDAQVSWLGVQTLARTAGSAASVAGANGQAFMFSSNVNDGNQTLAGQFAFLPDNATVSGPGIAAIMTWDFFPGQPDYEINVPPPTDTDTHEMTRRDPRAAAQMARFLATGEVVNTCGGPCNPLPSIAPVPATGRVR